jgi:hypothetical protein
LKARAEQRQCRLPLISLTLHQRQYWAWLLQRKAASGSVESVASTLDAIEARRGGIIENLEQQLEQPLEERELFTLEWKLV